MAKELDKQYSPQNVEDRTYKFWCDHKYFHAAVSYTHLTLPTTSRV